ncbi:MAG: hypothetical protein COA44_08860 [Arcobacter sp.]|nr:MAG: hypothetical protein COA44_08860 [Arcobacter sp.]
MRKIIFLLVLMLSTTYLQARVNNMFAQQIAENKKYNNTIREFMAQSYKIKNLVHDSYAHVVFPSIIKGGLIFGYASGDGRAYYRGGRWTGNVSITQYTFGVQVGGSSYSEIIFFKTREAFERFKLGEVEDSTQGSLVLFTGVSGDVNFDKDVEVYTLSKGGLMLEGSTGAQVFEYTQKP